ncbi:hypothetical protein EB836_07070 [Brevibacterium sp. S111]|nr:hypothetical protein EB836_07070 [Brevibacterium sp. S111]
MGSRRRAKRHQPAGPLCPDSGKRQYRNYAEAARVALRRSRSAGPLRIYRCPSCGSLHLTKRRNWGSPPPA